MSGSLAPPFFSSLRVGISFMSMNVLIFLLFCFVRLLNREQVVDEDASVDDEEENSFLKAFKVYISSITFLLLESDFGVPAFVLPSFPQCLSNKELGIITINFHSLEHALSVHTYGRDGESYL